MALINHAKKEINAKIVYYGCEGAGKYTSLKYIYDRIKPSLRGEIKTLPTAGGSLIFFDFSPFEAPLFGGFRVRFHIYTLPGRVENPAAWKMTLKGADGLMIVADCAPESVSAARESVLALREYLAAYGLSLHDVPAVLQHNSSNRNRAISPDDASSALDLSGVPTFISDATSGEGVLEPLSKLSRAVMNRIGQDEALRVIGAQPCREIEPASGGREGDQDEESAGSEVPASSDELPVPEQTAQPIEQAAGNAAGPEELQVELAKDGAVCHDGVVRIPLELTLGGLPHRLIVSIAIDQA